MAKGYQTVLAKANLSGKAIRTTLPAAIRDQFGLEVGDKINWRLEIKNNELVIIVTPVSKKEG